MLSALSRGRFGPELTHPALLPRYGAIQCACQALQRIGDKVCEQCGAPTQQGKRRAMIRRTVYTTLVLPVANLVYLLSLTLPDWWEAYFPA